MKSFIGFLFGLAISLVFAATMGESPWLVLRTLFQSSFQSPYDLGLTLYYMTALCFTGLAVAFSFRAGIFNIGAEGQLQVGAITCAYMGAQGSPLWVVILVSLMASAAWGYIPGFLKAKRGANEVVTTMMLNFISYGLAHYVVSELIPNPQSQNPETILFAANSGFQNDFVKVFFQSSPVSVFIIVAVISCLLLEYFFSKTLLGFQIDAVGSNELYAERIGISKTKIVILSLSFSGFLASFAGLNEVLGNAGQYRLGFSPEFGFMGIAVALLAQNRPIHILWSSFLLAALHKGASDLDLESQIVTRDFSKVLQALIILGIAIPWLQNWRKKKGASK